MGKEKRKREEGTQLGRSREAQATSVKTAHEHAHLTMGKRLQSEPEWITRHDLPQLCGALERGIPASSSSPCSTDSMLNCPRGAAWVVPPALSNIPRLLAFGVRTPCFLLQCRVWFTSVKFIKHKAE